MKKGCLFLLIIVIFFPIQVLSRESQDLQEFHFTGKTMGTTYTIKIVTGLLPNLSELQQEIDTLLKSINMSMSVTIFESEINRFNRHKSIEKMIISDDFFNVLTISKRLYQLTDGAWEGTLSPLIELWGFGTRKETPAAVPEQAMIRQILSNVGFNKIIILSKQKIYKQNPLISLNLSSVAKGYAVDRVKELLYEKGFRNCLVEIGGEVYCSGFKKDGEKWLVGINVPEIGALSGQLYDLVPLTDAAMATSGDYRNFVNIDGELYSHILDPATGFPVKNDVVSVSIISDSCTFADGLATAIFVMGYEKGLELVEKLDKTHGLIITRNKNKKLVPHYSDGFSTIKR